MADNEAVDIDVSNVDIEFIIDKSGSMKEAVDSRRPNMSRWAAAKETITGLAEDVAAHDDDGIGVTVFSDTFKTYSGVQADTVKDIFTKNSPDGATTLAPPLRSLIDKFYPLQHEVKEETVETVAKVDDSFFGKLGSLFGGASATAGTKTTTIRKTTVIKRTSREKPVCIIVVTDGVATDPNEVVQTIKDATKRINTRRDLGILLVQIGEDPQAKEFLDKIDNDLEGNGADHDIVAQCHMSDIENKSVKEILTLAYTA